MSSDANKQIVRRYLEEYVSGGDSAVSDELVGEGIVFASPYTPEAVRGIARFKEMIGGLRASFPDLRIVEDEVIAGGDLVAARWVASGTHTGRRLPGWRRSGAASRSAA